MRVTYSNYKSDKPENDDSGDIVSWVVVFILMVVFWPIGLLLLFSKLKGSKRKKRSALEKKSGKAIAVALSLVAVVLLILGANTIVRAVSEMSRTGVNRWPEFSFGAFFLVGGLISFFSRNVSVRRYARYKRHFAFVSGRSIIPIPDIARTTGYSSRVVKRDIQTMINEGFLDRTAYIDNELNSLVLSEEAAQDARRTVEAAKAAKANDKAKAKAAKEDKAAEAVAEEPASPAGSDNEYMANILELRRLGSNIRDISISDKVYRIEELTGKIFRIVEENPDKLPLIRRFSSYYLPTTMKLLNAYAMLEKQGIDGENISGAKENIERVLDTLVKGFEQQIDQLFNADALDIAADINVLENLLQQDGLA